MRQPQCLLAQGQGLNQTLLLAATDYHQMAVRYVKGRLVTAAACLCHIDNEVYKVCLRSKGGYRPFINNIDMVG